MSETQEDRRCLSCNKYVKKKDEHKVNGHILHHRCFKRIEANAEEKKTRDRRGIRKKGGDPIV